MASGQPATLGPCTAARVVVLAKTHHQIAAALQPYGCQQIMLAMALLPLEAALAALCPRFNRQPLMCPRPFPYVLQVTTSSPRCPLALERPRRDLLAHATSTS